MSWKQILDELKSTLRSDEFISLNRLTLGATGQSMQLLAMIDELDRRIAAETTDKASG